MPNGRFYTSEQLGTKQSLTPEGFLLCEDVPIARIGTMNYAEGELPSSIRAGADKLIRVTRDAEEVFSPRAILSFNGKPVTNDHPPEKVTPENFKQYVVGTVINPRRGDGYSTNNDFLYADLLLHDDEAIKDVRAKRKKEVSAGYDADYEQTAIGHARQRNIIGNHVALVDNGRCGPRCAIGDKAVARVSFKDRLLRAYHNRDEGALVEELDKVQDMLGEIVSDEAPAGAATGETPHHITVNVHGGAPSTSSTTPDEDPEAEAGAAAGGSVEETLAQIMERLDAIEQAIAILAQAEEDEVGGEGEGEEGGEEFGGAAAGEGAEGAEEGAEGEEEGEETGDAAHKRTRDTMREGYTAGGRASVPARPERSRGASADSRRSASRDSAATVRATVGDSTSMRGEFQQVMARAAILAPDIRMLTFDSKTPARTTFDTLCAFRKRALTEAWRNADTRTIIQPILAGANLQQMTCDAVKVMFDSAAELVRRSNNVAGGRVGHARVGGSDGINRTHVGTASIAEINKKNAEFYSKNR